MKTVIQRVSQASLFVNGELISHIDRGLAVYLGVEKDDSFLNAEYLAKKITNMRIFEDLNGKMNLSVKDKGGEILLISQFTLCANCTRGNRPDFFGAETPTKANQLYVTFGELLSSYGITVKYGVFGADMKIVQHNDGPVTIIL